MQQHWLTLYGSQLPDDVPYIMHVRHVDDYDAPTIPYPSCFVLIPGGFSYTADKAGTHQQCMVLKQVAGEATLICISLLFLECCVLHVWSVAVTSSSQG